MALMPRQMDAEEIKELAHNRRAVIVRGEVALIRPGRLVQFKCLHSSRAYDVDEKLVLAAADLVRENIQDREPQEIKLSIDSTAVNKIAEDLKRASEAIGLLGQES